MPPPDWDEIQKVHGRSPYHGKRDSDDGKHGGHGAHEHGMGAKEEHPAGTILSSSGAPLASASLPLAGVSYPAYSYITNVPPVRNQGDSPQCVAYACAYDQAHYDGRLLDFDEARFFAQIGGTADGASMSVALQRRHDFGYPTVAGGDAGRHKLAAVSELDRSTIAPFKSVIAVKRRGVLRIGPWFHSWFHPFASGKLPAPDYLVGWHATWFRGYNDAYGGRLRNSWGVAYGRDGDVFMPYSYMLSSGYMWFTADAA